jgi:hypothetical protein
VDQETVDRLIENTLKAVQEQFVTPLEVSLCIMTLAFCYDKKRDWVEKYFKRMAVTCPDGVAGRCIFEALANIASLPELPEPGAVEEVLGETLQLLMDSHNSES